MSDYRVDIKVRNNVFLFRLEKAGYKSVGELCRLHNKMSYASRIGACINMTESPFNADGGWSTQIQWVADKLNCAPEDLFTDVQLHTVLATNKKSIQVNEAEMKFMIEQGENSSLSLDHSIYEKQRTDIIESKLNTLTPRERQVLEMRFGMGAYDRTYSLREIAAIMGITAPRIRQIEIKALRKLRHPSRLNDLKLIETNIEDN